MIFNAGYLERRDANLHMKEYEAKIVRGTPSVPQKNKDVLESPSDSGSLNRSSDSKITQYQDWKWGTEKDLVYAAQKKSLCCQLYLMHKGMSWE